MKIYAINLFAKGNEMKKRITAILLLLCMLLGVVGCTGDGTDKPTEAPTESPTEPPVQSIEPNVIDDGNKNWYQIYVKSFFDTDGDGVGDLGGVIQKLSYIKDLGYDGIILMPVCPADEYHGKDVLDFCAIDPSVGNEQGFDSLMAAAHDIGITVLVDLGLNTTSASHPYFTGFYNYIKNQGYDDTIVDGEEYKDFYMLAPAGTTGHETIEGTGYAYKTWYSRPKLNLDSEGLRTEIVNIMKYWLEERGVDGFRLTEMECYYFDDAKNIDFVSWLNTEAKKIAPEAYILGELSVIDGEVAASYYESGIDSIQIFTSADATGSLAGCLKIHSGTALGELMAELQKTYGDNITTTYIASNSTSNRPASYLSGIQNIKMLAGIQLIMNGSISTLYGDEIGMISRDGASSDSAKLSGFKWTDSNYNTGYCSNSPTPNANASYIYAAADKQSEDENSILNFYRNMLYVRSCLPSIARGKVENVELEGNGSVCVVTKTYGDEKITVVINLAAPTDLSDVSTGAREVTLDKKTLGYEGIIASLCAYDITLESSYDETTELLVMPPYSIVILK